MNKDQELKIRIAHMLEEPLQAEACEVADIVLSRYKTNVTLRLFVYCDGGVALDKCAHLSRMIGDLIDETDLFDRGYTLEVSSPGLDRPLTTSQDFRFRIGETVKVQFTEKKRKKITAEIVSADSDTVTLRNDAEEITLNLDEIDRAIIVF